MRALNSERFALLQYKFHVTRFACVGRYMLPYGAQVVIHCFLPCFLRCYTLETVLREHACSKALVCHSVGIAPELFLRKMCDSNIKQGHLVETISKYASSCLVRRDYTF